MQLLARKTVQLLEQEVLGSTAGDWDAVVEVRGVPIFADIEKAKMEISGQGFLIK